MATPSQKLSESLAILHALQQDGVIAIRSKDLTRTHRQRLCKNGFLQEILPGWYIPTRPNEVADESTAWYASFWSFCAVYLDHLKKNHWCLSPEQSLLLHAENWTVPPQLFVRATKARNNITHLPHHTSLLVLRATLPNKNQLELKQGLRILNLPAALIACAPGFFQKNATDARTALAMIRDASEVLDSLLEGGHSTVAGRLAGAFRNIGRNQIADDIVDTMRSAGYVVREQDPFQDQTLTKISKRTISPYSNRLRLMWSHMREIVLKNFPEPSGLPNKKKDYLNHVDEIYANDAYHSLSIEGYRVSPELIERVRSGRWQPDVDEDDRDHRNALAARGYWQAYQTVRKSVREILNGKNPGEIIESDHSTWYREMFAPGVSAGLIKTSDLAGYRNSQVYIRRSMHVPLNCDAVRDAMPTFFDLLSEETEAAVRVVLGHFIFVYIHPYMDGNGRIGRFLMNAMLASGGYPWTIIPVEKRQPYMAALEEASTKQNILPFTKFLAKLVEES